MEERRKRNRKQLRFFTRVIDSHTGRFLGYLANLTMDGAMMISHRPLNKDTVLHFQIDLPENYAPQSQLGLHAKAIWSQPDTDPEFYKVGLKLSELTPQETDTLGRLLDEFGLE
ncbi:MAG: PilZ domain-containing protein [Chloroflexota bacterium]